MDCWAGPAIEHHLERVTRVKRRIHKGLGDSRLCWVFRSRVTGNAPKPFF